MRTTDVIEEYVVRYEKALETVLERANKYLQARLAEFNVTGGMILADEENLKYAREMTELAYESLDRAGYTKLADKYRDDFGTILKDVNSKVPRAMPIKFKGKDKALLNAMRDYEYRGMFRVESEVANQIQRLTSEYVLLETPIENLQAELKGAVTQNLKRYATTHITTATRQVVQKAEDITLDNVGIPEDERFWEYMGPSDVKTRDECDWALNKQYFTNDERIEFEIDYGLRYNCRHIFQYIPQTEYENGLA